MTEGELGMPNLRPGDVVRIAGGQLGVVVDALCLDDGRTYQWFVKVDTAGGEIGTWPPDQLLKSNDPHSISEARRLGLRFPTPRREGEFRTGDVVGSDDGRLGVVLLVQEHQEFLPGKVDVFVDMPGEGAGIWSPELLTLRNDPESIAEAKRLGLRFPWPGPSQATDALP